MSRQELAEAVNAYLHTTTGQTYSMDASHIAKFELGKYRWPRRYYREALRAVLGVEHDSVLGYPERRTPDDVAAVTDLPGEPAKDDDVAEADALVPVSNSVPVPSMPVQVSISPGTSVVIGCLGVNGFTPVREEFTTRLPV